MLSKVDKYLFSYLVLILIISLVFSLLLLEFDLYYVSDNDVFARVMGIINYDGIKSVNFNSVWLPFYKIIFGSIYFFLPNISSIFLLNIFFSSLGIFGIYLFSKSIFKDINISLLSITAYLYFPLRTLLSVLPLTETFFTSLLIFSLYFLSKITSKYYYIFFSLTYFLMTGLRFEAWYLIPFFLIIILMLKISKKKKLVMMISMILFPLLYLLINLITKDNALFFLGRKMLYADLGSIDNYYSIPYAFKGWFSQLRMVYPLSFLLLYFHGIYLVYQEKKVLSSLISLIPIYLFFMLVVQVYLGTMEWFPARYLLPVLVLTFPYLSLSLITLFKKLTSYFSKKLDLMIKLLFLLFFCVVLFFKTKNTQNIFYCNDYCSRYKLFNFVMENKSLERVPYITLKGSGLWIYNDGFSYYSRPEAFNKIFNIITQDREGIYCDKDFVVAERNAQELLCSKYKLIYEDTEDFLNIYMKIK